ncbi:AAA family ATPase [Methylobacter sp. G7]|uniref:AAA family ATPase n=1 Tax=Methylobacter sp. G7 TaxID=3230117 RepID=UPI003D801C40
MSNPPRIKSVTVKGLFNQFNHHIDFNQEERITILHGINGVGKTTLLRMINSLFNFRIYSFNEIPFTSFEIELSNGNHIRVEKKQHKIRNILNIFINKEKINFQNLDIESLIKRLPWISKVDDDVFYDRRTEEPLSLEEVMEQYGDRLPIKDVKNSELIAKLGHVPVQLIETSRLLRTVKRDELHQRKEIITHTVKVYAAELQQRIRSVMTDYAKKSQELEQTFPFRLLKPSENYTNEQLNEHIVALQNKRDELRTIGLLPTTDSATLDASSIDSLEAQHAAVMNLYVKDSEEKLAVLECLSEKIKLLLKIINSKFQGKSLRIDDKKGLVIIGKDGEIDPALLSSGEQHELVMFYDLIFKVEPNTLVMIDEPELSLHITWQHKFIDELKEIVEHSKFDVLIATHSPTIVGENSHLMVALGVNE